jgi:uncharacterized protein (UPF0332 family)
MEIRNVEDCFKFRLLRKIDPDLKKSERSMEIAKQSLKEAENAIKLKIFQFAILESYMAMFHSARALLYKDGIQEKSHFAVFVYLKELYSSKIPLHVINFLNIHRIERHETMYGLEYKPEKEDALTALEDAKSFVQEVEKWTLKKK